MNKLDLSKIEKEVLEILWKAQKPLTSTDIVSLAPKDSLCNKNRVHKTLNMLIEKGVVKTDSFVQQKKAFARTFIPTISFEEYTVYQLESSEPFTFDSVSKIVSGLLNTNKISGNKQMIIDELRAIIQENCKDEIIEDENTNEN